MIIYIHNIFIEMEWLINSILWHFKINADIIILDKFVILWLPFCVFTGYSVLPYANNSDLLATRQNKNNQLHGFGKLFHDLICQVLLKVHKSMLHFTDFCYLPPSQLKVLNFEACG